MPDRNKKFHEFAIKSILFKGRGDWYFCYLKAERIAHVMALLAEHSLPSATETLLDLAHGAAEVPGEIAHFAAGEMDIALLLADLFTLLSGVRLAATSSVLGKENALIIADEYESLAQKLAAGMRPSPFASAEDFALPELEFEQEPLALAARLPLGPKRDIKDNKGQIKDIRSRTATKGQTDRMSLILDFVRKNKSVSIKDIALAVTGCSEKTIQRELGALIAQGLIKKVGERRWSLYLPT